MNSRTKVLVVLNHDGYVEVYGERTTDVCVVNKIRTAGVEQEKVAERIVEDSLSRPYRKLYMPGLRRATGQFRDISPAQELYRLWQINLIRTCDRIASPPEDVTTWVA